MKINSREDLKPYIEQLEGLMAENVDWYITGVFEETILDEHSYETRLEDKLYSVMLEGNGEIYGYELINKIPYDDIGWICIALQEEIDKLNKKYII